MEMVVSVMGGLLCYAALGLNLNVHIFKSEDTCLHTFLHSLCVKKEPEAYSVQLCLSV